MRAKLILVICILLYMPCHSGVNLKNGNFYISYTDLNTTTIEFAFDDFVRTYNSKSNEVGNFGYGWGSPWETKLYFLPDGYIIVQEHGAGGRTAFYSDLVSEESVQLMVDLIIDAKLNNNTLSNNPTAILKRQNKLINNFELRFAEWINLLKKNQIDYEQELIVGLDFESNTRGNQKITITENGFERITISNQKKEVFNADGKLINLIDKNGNYTKIEYKNGFISKMICSDGNVIHLKTNDDGFITEAQVNDGKKAIYKYEGKKLIYSKKASGYQYAFEYDKNYNLTKIIYNPVRFKGEKLDAMSMTYVDKNGFIATLTDRNGDVTRYEYQKYFNEDGTENKDHYGTSVTKAGFNGQDVTNTYEYFIKVGASGKRYTAQINTKINGITTNTTYDELCSLPIHIKRGKRETNFTYNNRCKLIRKTSSFGTDVEMKYHPTSEKIVYVKNKDKETFFEYDTNGNLTNAKTNKGEEIELVYNSEGRIIKMISTTETLLFAYNSYGKPIEVEIDGVGKINVTYDTNGEIERVSSDDGHEMAYKVTQAFQDLLAIVKPSGVNLGI